MVKFSSGACCCVVMASKGYPQKYQSRYEIKIGNLNENENCYVAGAKIEDGVLKTSGGRVLGAVASANDLESAIKSAYKVVDKISFENAYFRKDIGKKALACLNK